MRCQESRRSSRRSGLLKSCRSDPPRHSGENPSNPVQAVGEGPGVSSHAHVFHTCGKRYGKLMFSACFPVFRKRGHPGELNKSPVFSLLQTPTAPPRAPHPGEARPLRNTRTAPPRPPLPRTRAGSRTSVARVRASSTGQEFRRHAGCGMLGAFAPRASLTATRVPSASRRSMGSTATFHRTVHGLTLTRRPEYRREWRQCRATSGTRF